MLERTPGITVRIFERLIGRNGAIPVEDSKAAESRSCSSLGAVLPGGKKKKGGENESEREDDGKKEENTSRDLNRDFASTTLEFPLTDRKSVV